MDYILANPSRRLRSILRWVERHGPAENISSIPGRFLRPDLVYVDNGGTLVVRMLARLPNEAQYHWGHRPRLSVPGVAWQNVPMPGWLYEQFRTYWESYGRAAIGYYAAKEAARASGDRFAGLID